MGGVEQQMAQMFQEKERALEQKARELAEKERSLQGREQIQNSHPNFNNNFGAPGSGNFNDFGKGFQKGGAQFRGSSGGKGSSFANFTLSFDINQDFIEVL